MIDGDEYTVSIEGPGMSIKQLVSRSIATQVLWAVFRSEQLTTPSMAGVGPKLTDAVTQFHSGGPIVAKSVRELLGEANPQRIPEKIAVFAVYLKDFRGEIAFTKEQINDVFKEAHEPQPKNLARDIAWAVKLGLVAIKDGAQGTYYVTNQGMKLVADGFPEDWRTSNKASAGGRPRKTKRKDADEENNVQA